MQAGFALRQQLSDDQVMDDVNATFDLLNNRPDVQKGQIGSEEEHARLRELEIALDQYWDLLRRRRAAREFGTDPNLIAGLELETRYASVRNSFRADLTRLQSELTHHDAAFA